jgi:hypothetical protein
MSRAGPRETIFASRHEFARAGRRCQACIEPDELESRPVWTPWRTAEAGPPR